MLSVADYDRLDATEMARLVRQRQVSPAELAETAVARAQVLNLPLNAVVTPLYQEARAAAQAALPGGAFAGVPFLVKDFGSRLGGVRQTGGSRALRTFVPAQDDELIRRWKGAGLNILGLTNAPEFALLGVTENVLHGATRNPWNLERTPGGSSGGSAAAVAAGIVPVAGAGDGGGSIRIPASHCALFGLKPSRGRVPCGPSEGELWFGAAVEHVLTRSVRDSAALLDAVQGADVGAPLSLAAPERPYASEVGHDPGPLKIGVCTAHPLGRTVHPEVIQAVRDSARLLEGLGHHLEEVPLPYDGHALAEAYLMLYFGQVGADLAGLRRVLGRAVRADEVEPLTWLLGQMGRTYTAADFAASRQSWNGFARRMGEFHQRYDLLLTPTAATPAVRIGELAPRGAELALLKLAQRVNLGPALVAAGVVTQMALDSLDKTPYTQIANLTGLPAMSVPLHWTPDGLPVGVQFIAALAREDTLLRLAAQLEQARPWFHRRPPLARA